MFSWEMYGERTDPSRVYKELVSCTRAIYTRRVLDARFSVRCIVL